MILEHEIPEGSKLYFADVAKKKRQIERIASELLENDSFEEIVVPLFSYHQHQGLSNEKELIRVNDSLNHNMSLRADTTIDVVRIINKRLGRNTKLSRCFYIQPVYRYPALEYNQIGAEVIGESDLFVALDINLKIFKTLEVLPVLQISNINIPKILSKMLELPLDDFRHIRIDKLLSLDIQWLTELIYLQSVEQIDALLSVVPDELRVELLKIKELACSVEYEKIVIAPLYYASMLYYDELFFRLIDGNSVYARGGRYVNDDITSVGFAIYTDVLLEGKN